MSGKEEKWRLEHEAADLFIASYNELCNAQFALRKHTDKPDFIATNIKTGEEFGVEITHLFYDDEEAKMLLGRSHESVHDIMANERLIEALNARLKKKTRQAAKYEYDHDIFLVVRVASPLFSKHDFDQAEKNIQVVENIFKHIYLVFQNQSKTPEGGLKRLK